MNFIFFSNFFLYLPHCFTGEKGLNYRINKGHDKSREIYVLE